MHASSISHYRVELELLIKHFMCAAHHMFVQRQKQKLGKQILTIFLAASQLLLLLSFVCYPVVYGRLMC